MCSAPRGRARSEHRRRAAVHRLSRAAHLSEPARAPLPAPLAICIYNRRDSRRASRGRTPRWSPAFATRSACTRSLESSLLPREPASRDDVSITMYYRPSETKLELGGDFLDVLDLGSDGLAVICGDVSGHGPDPPRSGAMLRVSCRRWCGVASMRFTWSEVCAASWSGSAATPRRFVTLCLGWIDPVHDELRLLNVGHPSPLLLEAVMPAAIPVRAPPRTGARDRHGAACAAGNPGRAGARAGDDRSSAGLAALLLQPTAWSRAE